MDSFAASWMDVMLKRYWTIIGINNVTWLKKENRLLCVFSITIVDFREISRDIFVSVPVDANELSIQQIVWHWE